jgi:type I restriction enzyme, S subunit
MSSKGKLPAATGGGAGLVPKRRFPEFQASEGWQETLLQKLARPVTDRATSGDADHVLSLSGEHGLVLQSDYFGKRIAGDSTDRYLRIRRDDFVYNDRTTKASSFGTIKRLSSYPSGIVSPIYKCFRFLTSENPAFWGWYFESGSHDPALGGLVNEGARAGRFNISVTQFLSTSAWRPDEPEQQKIADCLDSAEALIEAQGRKLEVLKAHKKGLMLQLFPQEGETQPRLRFPEFEEAGEWEEGTISDIGTVLQGYGFPERFQGLQSGDFPFYKVSDISRSLSAGKTFIEVSANHINQSHLKELRAKLIPAGTTVFAKIGEAIRSNKRAITTTPCLIDNNAAGVKSIKGRATDFFIYLTMEQISLIEHAGGVVPAVNKSAIEAIPVKFPRVAEQERIADCLTSLDDLIAAETQKLDTLRTHKKGLMQQLFPSVGGDDA